MVLVMLVAVLVVVVVAAPMLMAADGRGGGGGATKAKRSSQHVRDTRVVARSSTGVQRMGLSSELGVVGTTLWL